MRFKLWIVVALSLFQVASIIGCASTTSSERADTSLDHLWRQGCGYNNPNVERIRQGKKPLNMDGSEDTIENQLKQGVTDEVSHALGQFFFSGVSRMLKEIPRFFRPFN